MTTVQMVEARLCHICFVFLLQLAVCLCACMSVCLRVNMSVCLDVHACQRMRDEHKSGCNGYLSDVHI